MKNVLQSVPTIPEAEPAQQAGPAYPRSKSTRLAFVLKSAVAEEVHRYAIEYFKVILVSAVTRTTCIVFVKRAKPASQREHFEQLNELAKFTLIVRRLRCVWRCLHCNSSLVRHRPWTIWVRLGCTHTWAPNPINRVDEWNNWSGIKQVHTKICFILWKLTSTSSVHNNFIHVQTSNEGICRGPC